MILKLGDFEIYIYDASNPNQRHLKYVLNEDADFRKYVTKKIEERLKETDKEKKELQFNSSYLVKYKDDFVGYIRLEELSRDGSLNIEYAVSKEFRHQNLGKKILVTISEYILKNIKEVICLKGVIEKSNYISRKIAKEAGFQIDKRDDFYVYVSKTR